MKETETMCSDAALVMQIKAGDKKAFGTLVERHKKLAYRLALGLVGNKDDAHDISQEAFLRVYKSAATYDEAKPFLPWFYAIISNLCRTWLSRRSRHNSRYVNIDDAAYLMVAKGTPESSMIKKEVLARLREALMRLPFADREIITLQHFRGMSYDEIARLLNIPRGTVMSRLYYARKKLATLMKEDNGER
ncbi:MAG: RNA polymerase sigma factor [Candidatus Zixiibacteriota bacterium]